MRSQRIYAASKNKNVEPNYHKEFIELHGSSHSAYLENTDLSAITPGQVNKSMLEGQRPMPRLTGYSSVRVSRAKRAYEDLSSLFLVLMRVHGLRYAPRSTKREELQNDYLPLRD